MIHNVGFIGAWLPNGGIGTRLGVVAGVFIPNTFENVTFVASQGSVFEVVIRVEGAVDSSDIVPVVALNLFEPVGNVGLVEEHDALESSDFIPSSKEKVCFPVGGN